MLTVLYKDSLVIVTDESIELKNYYFPFGKSKNVYFKEIEWFKTTVPNLRTGKYRWWGTGDLVSWFPMDDKRQNRDFIFILKSYKQKIKICFTVEDSSKVIGIFNEKNIKQLN